MSLKVKEQQYSTLINLLISAVLEAIEVTFKKNLFTSAAQQFVSCKYALNRSFEAHLDDHF